MTLPASHALPALSSFSSVSSPRVTLVLVAGWGADKRTWQLLLPYLDACVNVVYLEPADFIPADIHAFDLDVFFEQMAQALFLNLDSVKIKHPQAKDSPIIVSGWSLGGMIAMQLAHRFPQKIHALITLATNANFVANTVWPNAMTAETYTAFCESYQQFPEKTTKRFHALQVQGDTNKRSVSEFLKNNTVLNGREDKAVYSLLLKLLDDIKNVSLVNDLTQPYLGLFGESDNLVPVAVARQLTDIFSKKMTQNKRIDILSDCGHALHISQPQRVAEYILNFVLDVCPSSEKQFDSPYVKNKINVALSFDKAAHTYDGVAQLQRDVADALFNIKHDYHGDIADIGCGTGYCGQKLLESATANIASLVSIDLSANMVTYAREKRDALSINISPSTSRFWVCGDMEYLPLATDSMDGLVSSLCVQWSDDLASVFAEAQRVLKPKGWFLLATLAENTLHELVNSWRQADPNYVHVNSFLSQLQIVDLAGDAGFYMQDFMSEQRVMTYNHATDLMRELKALGAHNVNSGSNRGLTGRATLRKLTESYEQYRRADGLLPATYDVVYLLLEKR